MANATYVTSGLEACPELRLAVNPSRGVLLGWPRDSTSLLLKDSRCSQQIGLIAKLSSDAILTCWNYLVPLVYCCSLYLQVPGNQQQGLHCLAHQPAGF